MYYMYVNGVDSTQYTTTSHYNFNNEHKIVNVECMPELLY